jgi:hypothetical protein
MPYRRNGKVILQYKDGSWRVKQTCKTFLGAKRAIRLLYLIEKDRMR